MTEPDGRRRRPAVSCALCRKRKIRCNRETPCSNCVRSRNESCVYDYPPHRPRQAQTVDSSSRESGPIDRLSSTSRLTPNPITPESQPSSDSAELRRMRLRIRQLEDQLAKSTTKTIQSPVLTPNSNIQTTSSHLGGTFHVHCDNGLPNHQGIARCVSYKNRLLGQSHWAVSGILQIRNIFDSIDTHLKTETPEGIEKCKSLARIIKAHRTPLLSSPSISDLPSKDVADTLVDCYLRTSESIYRILHIPTFRRDYEKFWVSGSTSDTNFLVQLQLVLAIGATVYDERFSLRSSAVRWVSAAQTWLSEPKFKSRLDLQSLQTDLLYLIAQERVGHGGYSTWILVGSLFRKAVCVGLHRDPAYLPRRTVFVAEMRRRLWNTILEITLQSSLTSGSPPFISLADFDTAPPGNFEDDQLLTDDPVPHRTEHFTQISIAIALRETFPQRLAVVKFLNDLGSRGTYQETLWLDAELRTAYKSLCQTLQAYDSDTRSLLSQNDIRIVEFIVHRYISSLHVPYFSAAVQETTYYYSRKVVVESSLKIWRAAYPSSSASVTPFPSPHDDTSISECDSLLRLTTCTSGFYSTVTIHAAFLIAVELWMQLQEENGLSPVPLRPDLLCILEESKAWLMLGIEAGETNVKGYMLMSIVAAQIEGLIRGMGNDEIAELLVEAVENVGDKCLPILERMATAAQEKNPISSLQQDPFDDGAVETTTEDWGFLSTDALFDEDWVFDENSDYTMPSLW